MLATAIERVTITPHNIERILAEIVPKDQRRLICCGDTISYYGSDPDDEEPVHVTIWHNQGRAGVCWTWESEWGAWDERDQTIRLDECDLWGEQVVLNRLGGRVDDERW